MIYIEVKFQILFIANHLKYIVSKIHGYLADHSEKNILAVLWLWL